MRYSHFPEKQGLYDPRFEHDSCGVGFVCNVDGAKTHDIVENGLKVLRRLSHRGAVGADPKTGDGAGILMQVPHKFLIRECSNIGITLPREGEYGVGLVFLPTNKKDQDFCIKAFEDVTRKEGLVLLGWRDVPCDDSVIGTTARDTKPVMRQIFISRNALVLGKLEFERKLYIVRRQIENIIYSANIKQRSFFYITNLSSRTLSYKGLLMPSQLEEFFLDLKSELIESALALVHSRYSTNTFPTWDLAQPFRFLAHNGEINTLRGNINWMRARERLLESELFGKDIKKIKPVIVPEGSDSAAVDNVFELLVLSGCSLSRGMMMLIPAAWEKNKSIDKKLKDFYKYHASIMEPWDGPAAIAFTDGERIGAVLDRNGLRPARYLITKSGLVVMASEAGVLDLDPGEIKVSGRLEPGKMFFIDTEGKRIIDDEEIKDSAAEKSPYGSWLRENMVELDKLPSVLDKLGQYPSSEVENTIVLQKVFGYTREDLKFLIEPMAETGEEPTGSMGNDTPHAVLSKRPKLLYNYFKQLFAQVTNPAIDSIREDCVMSLESFIGPEKNILGETPGHCHRLRVKNPILMNKDLGKIRNISVNNFKTKTISILFDPERKNDFSKTLDRICKDARSAIKDGYSFIILSDRGVDGRHASLPALLAVGCVHHYLVEKALRTQIGIVLESAEPREVHHFALLFGYGVDAVNPYLVYGILDSDKKIKNYIKAVEKGILKILSKMGISTLQSYRGAQIFEALGLGEDIIERSFTGTVSRIGGASLDTVREETIARHKNAFEKRSQEPYLETGGVYQWKRDGEFHLWNPESIAGLQDATRENNYEKYKEFAQLINNQSKNPTTLRSLFKFKNKKPISPIPIEEVEPKSEIFQRFATGAMSFGSISRPAHETLAIAMNRIGGRSNTGEGGEDPSRFTPMPNGDSRRSAIKQVASGRFGVTTNYLVNADELQIKIAQGAKPGEGGQLPGHKVSVTIASTRYTTPGVTLISPPPHHDIYSIEDLAQLIFDLKNVNPHARISVKLVSEIGVGTIAAGVAKGHADMILISGGDGGTGASPRSSIMHAGLPWELGLAEAHQTLVLNDLRSSVRLQTDGQMRTGRDIAIAAILGAEEFGFCTAPLIVMGCVMLRHCHLNNCSLGVATQDETLECRFRGKPEHVVNYFNFVAEELREIMAGLGIRTLNELIGRTDLLEIDKNIRHWKAKDIDYSGILYRPPLGENSRPFCVRSNVHEIYNVLDKKLIKLARHALEKGTEINEELDIKNFNRTTGAMLSGEVCRKYGEGGLPDETIRFKFKGAAGQGFGAWLAKGITFELEGMANDYIGKGISGGRIIAYPDKRSSYKPEENIIIGNTTFYGAIRGEAYIRGVAGERFCIRNSGLNAVIEGVGDHGCEYMTGGRVVILGRTGRNFAAGMSGGIAYVYDEKGDFKDKCNTGMVELEKIDDDDKKTIQNLLTNHYGHTRSSRARKVLDNFRDESKKIIKVMPIEYKSILEQVSDG